MWYRHAKGHYTTAIVALYVPSSVGKKIILDKKECDEYSDLEGLSDLHITLCYLGEIADIKDKKDVIESVVAATAKQYENLTGEISGRGIFNSENSDGDSPVYASVDCPNLSEFREKLVSNLENAGIEIGKDHGFTPHITLGWLDYDQVAPMFQVKNVDVKFNQVTISWGEKPIHFKFGGK
jgi:2'-5' RNA ligase